MFGAPFPGTPGAGGLSQSFVGFQSQIASLSTFTFTYSFSAPNTNRRLIVPFAWVSGGPTLSSVAIGGISASIIGSVVGSVGTPQLAFYEAQVPTNVDQTVQFNFTGAIPEMAASLYDLEGVTVFSAVLSPSTAHPFSASVNVPGGGSVLGASWPAGAGSTSNTWTGITKDVDSVVSSSRPFTSAHDNFAIANPSLSVTDTPNGSPSQQSSGVVVFSP